MTTFINGVPLAVPYERKPDLRFQDGIHSLCSASKDSSYSQNECKYYKTSKNRGCCMYDKFDFMCDKLTINDKEIN